MTGAVKIRGKEIFIGILAMVLRNKSIFETFGRNINQTPDLKLQVDQIVVSN
jgi:hypothetical protein